MEQGAATAVDTNEGSLVVLLNVLLPFMTNPLVFTSTFGLVMSLTLLSLLRYANATAAFQRAPLIKSPVASYATLRHEVPSLARETFTPCGTLMPRCVHRVLSRQDVRSRVLVVGDVHGCLRELQALLKKVQYDQAQDTVVLVGDLVNKGPLSAETVQFCRQENFYSVRGNHDDAAMGAWFRTGKFKNSPVLPPAYSFVDQLSEEDVAWLGQLPYTISIPHLNAIIVHAGLLPGRPLEEQMAVDMSRIRSVVDADGSLKGVDYIKGEGVSPWAKVWSEQGGQEHVLFGHDARRMLQVLPRATGLDTGACYGKELTLAILPGGERVSVPAFASYAEGKD